MTVTAPHIPGYAIVREVGRGGMGVVYEATQLSLNRRVALKLLPAHLASNPGFVDRFKREASTAARMEHPHIVPVYDFGQSEGQFFIVMQYVEGKTLDEAIVRGQPLPAVRCIDILRQVAAALDHAHQLGVVHRDVKPANIIIRSDNGQAMLMDFGVAKVAASTQMTSVGATIGTPDYMAPEACKGEQATARSDIYSLGCVAFEMLTGHRPFGAPDTMGVMYKHINEPPPSVSGINRAISGQTDSSLARMLDKKPEVRPPSASAAVFDLGRGLNSGVPRSSRGSRSPLIGALGALLVGLIGLIGWSLYPQDTKPVGRSLPSVGGLSKDAAKAQAEAQGWSIKLTTREWNSSVSRNMASRVTRVGATKEEGLRLWISKGPKPSDRDLQAARILSTEARNTIDDVLQKKSTYGDADAAVIKERLHSAIKKAEEAISLDPDLEDAYAARSQAYYVAANFGSARKASVDALELFPENAELLQIKRYLIEKGEWQ